MRPFIDLENLSYSKEKLIYYSQSIIFVRILGALALIIFAIYSVTVNHDFAILFFLVPIIFFIIYRPIKLLKKINEVQFRINSKGIQYQNENLVSWDNIENERVETEISGRHHTCYFVYYIIDQDKFVKHNIADFNTDAGELSHTLKIQRNRYVRENLTQS